MTRLEHGHGETDSWRAKTKHCACQDPEEGAGTQKETTSDLPVSVQEYVAEACVSSSLLQGPGHLVQQGMNGSY